MIDTQSTFIDSPMQYAADVSTIPKHLKRIGFDAWVSENSAALASKYLKRFNLQKFCEAEIITMMENSLANDLRNSDYIDEDDPQRMLLNFLLDEYQEMIDDPNCR